MDETTAPLDRFLPEPDVAERFETTIRAPADLVMDTAAGFDMQSVPAVRAIFRLRDKLLRASASAPREARGLREEMESLGWGLLEEEPGRLLAYGAVCQPWLADVTFSATAPADFVRYAEPGQVKIAWSLEASRAGPAVTRFGQETRAAATDEAARIRFRGYWRWARFGIVAVRLLLLPAIRRAAERRWLGQQVRR